MVALISLSLAQLGESAFAACNAEFEQWFNALPEGLSEGKRELYDEARDHPLGERGMASYSFIDEMVLVQYYLGQQKPVNLDVAARFILVDDWLACTEARGTPETPEAKAFFADFDNTVGDSRYTLRQIAETAQ